MKFGIIIPSFRPGAGPEGILAATQTSERLGWVSAWTTDHVLIDHSKRGADYGNIYEALTTLAWLGGQTSSIRLGISVLIVPMRNAVVLAKELATIDALTNGRLIAGVGIGWNRNEFANLGADDRFSQRGAYLEETVALWRYLWGGGTGPYEGAFDSFGEARFGPLPAQGAAVPIWIGATAEKALERVGRIADGYQSTGTGPAEMHDRARTIAAAAAAADRPMPSLSSRVSVVFEPTRRSSYDVSGSVADMVERINAFRDAGVSELDVDFRETDPAAVVGAMERFDRDVIAAL